MIDYMVLRPLMFHHQISLQHTVIRSFPFLQVGTDELFQRQSATVSLMSSFEKLQWTLGARSPDFIYAEKLNEIRHTNVRICNNWQSDSSDISLHKVISHSCDVVSNGHSFPSHLTDSLRFA